MKDKRREQGTAEQSRRRGKNITGIMSLALRPAVSTTTISCKEDCFVVCGFSSLNSYTGDTAGIFYPYRNLE